MEQERVALFPTVAVRLAALWVAAGALFKLFAGSPADLPPVLHDVFFGTDLNYRLAISIELVFLTTALLRPKWGWPWLVALHLAFLAVLMTLVVHVMHAEKLGFVEASTSGSCGCFGGKIKTPPAIIMGIDLSLVVLVLASRPWRKRLGAWGPTWLPTGFAALAVIAPWFVSSGTEKAVVRTDEKTGRAEVEGTRFVDVKLSSWEGQLIYDVEFAKKFIPGLDQLPTDGTYVFYRATCDHCAQHIRELAEQDDGTRPFVFLEIPEEGVTEANRVVTLFPEGGHVTKLTLPKGTEYLITTPADFQLEGGVVTATREGIGREGG